MLFSPSAAAHIPPPLCPALALPAVTPCTSHGGRVGPRMHSEMSCSVTGPWRTEGRPPGRVADLPCGSSLRQRRRCRRLPRLVSATSFTQGEEVEKHRPLRRRWATPKAAAVSCGHGCSWSPLQWRSPPSGS